MACDTRMKWIEEVKLEFSLSNRDFVVENPMNVDYYSTIDDKFERFSLVSGFFLDFHE